MKKLSRLNDLIENGEIAQGTWRLGPDHELEYRSRGSVEEIKLKGALIAAEPEALVFSITERQSDQKIVAGTHRLAGAWRADDKNRLVFEVERQSGKNDVLTFRNGWELGDSQRIIYTYERTNLKTKKKERQELAFDGTWDISDKNGIAYFLRVGSDSVFRFRGAFQTKSILAKKGEIRYQLGVEVRGRRRAQTLVLFGKWKVSRDLGLSFEIEYEDGVRAVVFGGEYRLDDSSRIAVELRSREGEPLGAELILTRDIFRDGQVFVRLRRSLEESNAEAGVKFLW